MVKIIFTSLLIGFAGAVPQLRAATVEIDCQALFGDDANLSSAVESILSTIFAPAEERAHAALFANLVALIASDLKPMDVAARIGVLGGLMQTESRREGFVHDENSDQWARIADFGRGPTVLYDAALDRSAALMYNLAHEAVHLVYDFTYELDEIGGVISEPRPVGPLYTYLSERRAIGREHDLVRATYQTGDLDGLRERFETPLRRFMAAGVDAIQTAADAREFNRLWANASFFMSVSRIMEKDRFGYTRDRLRHYRAHHAKAQAIRFLMSADDLAPPETGANHGALIDLVTRVNLDLHRARYPHKY